MHALDNLPLEYLCVKPTNVTTKGVSHLGEKISYIVVQD